MRVASLALVLAGALGAGCGVADEPPLNVVLLVLDTTRADRCTVNGYGRPTTPRLQALAAEGVVYVNAWSPAGWTGPAHASLFTGLRPENHGFHRSNRHYLLPGQTTLAERFRAAGYRTGAFTNNVVICSENGLDQGFDTFVPLHDERDREYPWAPGTHAQALDWARSGARPFLLFINDMEPHLRYDPPRYDAARFVAADVPEEGVHRARRADASDMFAHNAGVRTLSESHLALLSDLYDAEIASVDRAVGQLVDGLRDAGLLDRTVVVVTSDHGENLGDHGLTDHMFSIHRSIRHVPLVIRYPDGRGAGTRVPDVVRLEDLFPTLLEVCGLPPGDALDGVSLLGDIQDRVAYGLVDPPDTLVARRLRESEEAFDPQPLLRQWRGVFDGRYHYLRDDWGREQLYDVPADPSETRNLAVARPLELQRMRGLLDEAYPASD